VTVPQLVLIVYLIAEKDRQYNKPWQANSKPTKYKGDSTDLTKSGMIFSFSLFASFVINFLFESLLQSTLTWALV